MERHDGKLHREGDEEAQHQQVLDARRQLGLEQQFVVEGKGAGVVVIDQDQPEDRHQHDQTAGLGVDEEFGCRIDPRTLAFGAMAPECDEEIHRHQHHFPEKEEQEQVEREEHPDHAAEDPHQVQVEEADVALDLFPGTKNREHAEQSGQYDHQQRQAIERQVQVDAEALDPDVLELQRPVGLGARSGRQLIIAGCPQPEADREQQRHGEQGDPAWQALVEMFDEPAEQAADEGNQD